MTKTYEEITTITCDWCGCKCGCEIPEKIEQHTVTPETEIQFNRVRNCHEDAGVGASEVAELTWNEENPTTPGWYAVAFCWGDGYGTFVSTSEWNGGSWDDDDLPIWCNAGPFEIRDDAETWAFKNDYWQAMGE